MGIVIAALCLVPEVFFGFAIFIKILSVTITNNENKKAKERLTTPRPMTQAEIAESEENGWN